jgi:hypothetical protein
LELEVFKVVSIKIEVCLNVTPYCFVDRIVVEEFPASIFKAKDFYDFPKFHNILFLTLITLKVSCIATDE